jgi:hypothetical protein
MNKRGISKMSKILVVLQLAIVVGAVILFYMLAPSVNYSYGDKSKGEKINFNFRNANVILLSDEPDFSNPVAINLSLVNLSTMDFTNGKHYIKAVGIMQSIPIEFIVNNSDGISIVDNTKPNANTITNENGLKVVNVSISYVNRPDININSNNNWGGK